MADHIVAGVGSFFRRVEDFTIRIPALPRPTLEEVRASFSLVNEIKNDCSPTEAIFMELGTILCPNEERISDKEYEFRLGSDSYLGFQQALWLEEHQDRSSEFMILSWKTFIDFPGLKVVRSDGDHLFPCLCGGGGRWHLRWHCFRGGSRRDIRVARPCQPATTS